MLSALDIKPMSVIVVFSINQTEFALGRALKTDTEMDIEVERIVPTGREVMPFFWASGENFTAFEEQGRDNEQVVSLQALDRLDDQVLYRITWVEQENELLGALIESNAVVLESKSGENWHFRVRFHDPSEVTKFYNICINTNLRVHIDRTYTLKKADSSGWNLGLTQAQREALVQATRRGYFETPKRVQLTELADELDISQQALSSRIRRGLDSVMKAVLLTSASNFERGEYETL